MIKKCGVLDFIRRLGGREGGGEVWTSVALLLRSLTRQLMEQSIRTKVLLYVRVVSNMAAHMIWEDEHGKRL